MKRAYVDIPEGQIHYQSGGSGEPILLLHLTALSSDEYTKLMPILAKSYHVIAMDTLGYGKSDPPPRQYEIADYARSVTNLLKALGISRISVFGDRTGATIAVELAAAYPKLVNKLILLGFPNYTPEMREQLSNSPRYQPMEIKEDGSHIMEYWQRHQHLPGRALEIRQMSFVGYMMAGTRVHDAHQSVWRYPCEERLPLVKSPTLLVCGDKDNLYDQLESTQGLIPRCQTKIIKGGGPSMSLEMPEVLAHTILNYLK
ncbi:alpha/beta fold hydrolase [Chloroflexota bacterium]